MLAPTDTAVTAFLADSMVCRLTTLSSAGRPFVTPIWFVVDAGTLYMTTGQQTWAARNIVRHPNVAILFGGEDARRDSVLRLHGTASCHAGLPPWRVLARIALKYYVAPSALAVELRHAAQWSLRARYYAQAPGGAGHLRIVPTAAEMLAIPR
jgi:hypothetical protein